MADGSGRNPRHLAPRPPEEEVSSEGSEWPRIEPVAALQLPPRLPPTGPESISELHQIGSAQTRPVSRTPPPALYPLCHEERDAQKDTAIPRQQHSGDENFLIFWSSEVIVSFPASRSSGPAREP